MPFNIILTSSPELVQPVYNPFYFVCTSTNVTQPNYKFVFDVYITGQTQSTRFLLPPRPVTNNCVFSPARILESFITYDLLPTTIGFTGQTNTALEYSVNIGEQYGLTSTGATVYPNLNIVTGVTFGGVVRYEQLPSWDWTNYVMTATTGQFLTNQPSSVIIRNNEMATLSFLNAGAFLGWPASYINTGTPPIPMWMKVTTYQSSGGTKIFYIVNPLSASTGTTGLVEHFGSGIYNINNIPNSLIDLGQGSSHLQPIININTDYKYTLQLFYFPDQPPLSPISEIQTYLIDTTCTKYQPIRLMFQNRLGCFDYFTAIYVSRKTLNQEKKTYKQVLDYNYTVGQRGYTVADNKARESIQVSTNWVDTTTSSWLEELFSSPEVYELQSDGTTLPVIMNNDSIEIKKTINDKLINYDFAYTYAYEYETARG